MPRAFDTIRALDFPPSVWAEEPTNIDVTSNTFITTGGPLCGVVFVAPTSGSGTIHIGLFGDSDDTNPTGAQIGVSVKTGAVLNSGTEVLAPNAHYSVTVGEAGEADASDGVAVDVPGLTQGEQYNAVLYHRRTGTGTGTIFHRTIKWVPDATR